MLNTIRWWYANHEMKVTLISIVVVTLVAGFITGTLVGYNVGTSGQNPTDGGMQMTSMAPEPAPITDLSKGQRVAVDRLQEVGYKVRVNSAGPNDVIEVSGSVRRAFLQTICLDGFHFIGTDLAEATLTEASLANTMFVLVNLSGANLAQANFYRTTLTYSDLRGADLRYARFYDPELGFADLRGTNLQWTIFDKTSLIGADIGGADLRGADFSSAIFAQKNVLRDHWVKMKGARYDATTKWPDGFDPKAAGTVLVK